MTMPPVRVLPFPDALRFPLTQDTHDWVIRCCQLYAKPGRNGNSTNDWVELRLGGLDGLNPALFLNKFCPDAQALKALKSNNARYAFLNGWASMASGQPAAHAAALVERRQDMLKDLWQDRQEHSRSLTRAVVWRMIIGMGNPNPLETSLTLHPQYGIPLVPSSAVKGLTRQGRLLGIGAEIGVYPLSPMEYKERESCWEPTPLDRLERLLLSGEAAERSRLLAELQADKAVLEAIAAASPPTPATEPSAALILEGRADSFRRAFGTTQNQGEVVFLDALPLPEWSYEVDVMTPHYGDYYKDTQHKTPPADWLDPNPVTFLTIGKDSRFRFDVTGKDDALLSGVNGWLETALAELGAGGKTSAGYGEMLPVNGEKSK